MKAHCIITIFLILSFAADSKFINEEKHSNRRRIRILHQPFFPYTSSPPPPPPSPPPSDQDQPFFHSLPVDQSHQTPPAPPPPPSRQSNSIKKLAIAVSSAMLALAMVLAVAFVVHSRRIKKRHESQKLVGGDEEPALPPPSNFLYIGTVEPSAASVLSEAGTDDASASPYRKLNSAKRFSRYRPSPDLQPLPPLTKPPPPPPAISSPPPMSSSDDESHDTVFYTPQGSSVSHESPSSRHSHTSHTNRVAHSKRSSPKSRLSASSQDTKPVIIPSIKPPSPPPPPPNSHKRNKLARPPPPPPPPPLPPPLSSIAIKYGDVQHSKPPPFSNKVIKPETKSPSPKSTFTDSSTVKVDVEDSSGSKPKLKPLHWDKVRATSDRVTVWDQLNSSSFQ